ncbi:LADA_0H20010g1_1 [Lachancea dasiensis]|uniref:LADA_0H20010g1_1 n=1 Tax=Lachancea dasiensis TaxID=1072105 RepID=A0A1G4K6J8_9SACH|nr:LADA_0H20010g1_1 [Lachancea dasiensis]
MATICSSGYMPTRPGTVYLGKYSLSRDTLEETKPEVIADFEEPPRSARSFRSTIRKAWVKPLEPRNPTPPATRHHRFRRWLNVREKEFTCSWSDGEDPTSEELERTHGLVSPQQFNRDSTLYAGLNSSIETPHVMKTTCWPDDDTDIEMFSRILLNSTSGATLSDHPTLKERLQSSARSSGRRRFELLRKFRLKLHRSRIQNEFTLTDRYLGSEENIERCLQDMDMMPFDLTAPSTAGAEVTGVIMDGSQISGALSDKSTVVEESFCPYTLQVKNVRVENEEQALNNEA